ncbi:recombinase family protein [Streptomyces gilvosporeus]|uniref:Resolvase n=1 Tax=Streptomyces gilvosporeus TaxID=553510 RepID=A0A1V0TTH0_9ACTN|nr:recombinase family protein [Streptomyces gilvosporeus]ARF56058.1 resolvase [Streptomyces gilvosporeus]
MAKPKRVGIYVRISKDRKGQELGIQRQEKACRELCERLGWGVLKIYAENDTSASTTSKRQRKVYTEMLRDARAGVIDGIVVYSIDRLTRRIAELTYFLEEQKEHGFAFATTEGEDTATANGRMILTIKGAVAQQETERMSERINLSLLQRREKGKPHAGGSRLFGFKEGSHFQELEPGEVELIRLGYEMLMDQKTPGDVSRKWNEHGARTPEAGTAWDIQKIKRVYRSERIGGIVTYKRQDIGDSIYPHPLTRQEWENVQTVLDSRARPAGKGAGKRKHVYSGFLTCGHCGSTMRIQWATIQGRTFRRAFCHSAQIGANGEHGCGKVNRRYDWIEERLNEVVEAALLARRPKPQTPPTDDVTEEIKVLEERIRGLRNRWKEGGMEDEDYFDSLSHLRSDLQALRAREAAATVKEARTETDALAVWRDEEMQNLERRRAIVASVIAECEVFSVGRGRKKPPELDSIRVWPVGAERD